MTEDGYLGSTEGNQLRDEPALLHPGRRMTEDGYLGSTEGNQSRDEPAALLHPGQLVEHDGASWQVWALEADGTVGLVRRTLGTRPHFLRIPATHLRRRKGTSAG